MIQEILGDVTEVDISENEIVMIPHCCNDIGGWGAGVVMAISKKWENPEKSYKNWAEEGTYYQFGRDVPFQLGNVQYAVAEKRNGGMIIVCNMIGQRGVISKNNRAPVRYDALEACINDVRLVSEKLGTTLNKTPRIQCPKFGAGLAGGDWSVIIKTIENHWKDLDVTIVNYKNP
jgi:O-acetyl-ADP-ribose deacetylase (regulator of RNase III)